MKAITHAGYTSPTDVQARAVPLAMSGRDLLVSSQTGSGKTAAFVWPALERILAAWTRTPIACANTKPSTPKWPRLPLR